MANRRRRAAKSSRKPVAGKADSPPRIIAGDLRGKRIHYSGDPRTRPMKERVREATFSLLGDAVFGAHVVDLFAGTGMLALEAISRGAFDAVCCEQHFPTADLIARSAAELGVAARVNVVPGDVFLAGEAILPPLDAAWIVFCCPPYALFDEQGNDLEELMQKLIAAAPRDSRFVIESEQRYSPRTALSDATWSSYAYPPAYIHIAEKE